MGVTPRLILDGSGPIQMDMVLRFHDNFLSNPRVAVFDVSMINVPLGRVRSCSANLQDAE